MLYPALDAGELMEMYLHVGHGKTGRSFLQSWWSVNRLALCHAARLLYPVAEGDRRAQAGEFSMGNGTLLDQVLDRKFSAVHGRRWWRLLCP